MYEALGGNPWAAMPSLHFATSVLARDLARRSRPGAGRGRLGLRADPRLRPRLPRRALRHRPDRRGRAGRRRAPRRPVSEPAVGGVNDASSAWSGSRTGSFSWCPGRLLDETGLERHRRIQRAELPLFTPRRVIQTGVVVLALLVGDLLPLPEAGRPERRARQARRCRPGLDRGRDRLLHRLLRHLHRALQGGGRRRRTAPHLGRDLRDQHGRGRRHAALLGGRGGRHRPHLLGAAQGGDAPPRRRPAGWSPSSPSTTPSTRSR